MGRSWLESDCMLPVFELGYFPKNSLRPAPGPKAKKASQRPTLLAVDPPFPRLHIQPAAKQAPGFRSKCPSSAFVPPLCFAPDRQSSGPRSRDRNLARVGAAIRVAPESLGSQADLPQALSFPGPSRRRPNEPPAFARIFLISPFAASYTSATSRVSIFAPANMLALCRRRSRRLTL